MTGGWSAAAWWCREMTKGCADRGSLASDISRYVDRGTRLRGELAEESSRLIGEI